MHLDDFCLTLSLLEMDRGFGMQMFAVRKRKLFLPEDKDEGYSKNNILRIPINWRGQSVSTIWFTQSSGKKNIEIIVNCPVAKTNSTRRFHAWCTVPDTLPDRPTVDETMQFYFSALGSYSGTNSARVVKLLAGLEAEYAKED